MAMLKMKCPSCGGELTVNQDQDSFFCMYCGSKVENTANKKIKIEKTERHIDEAEVLKAKFEQEKYQKEHEANKHGKIVQIVFSGILVAVGLGIIVSTKGLIFQVPGGILMLVGALSAIKAFK